MKPFSKQGNTYRITKTFHNGTNKRFLRKVKVLPVTIKDAHPVDQLTPLTTGPNTYFDLFGFTFGTIF